MVTPAQATETQKPRKVTLVAELNPEHRECDGTQEIPVCSKKEKQDPKAQPHLCGGARGRGGAAAAHWPHKQHRCRTGDRWD